MRWVVWLVMWGEGITNTGCGDTVNEYIRRTSNDGSWMKPIMICPNIPNFRGFLAQTVLLVINDKADKKGDFIINVPIETIKTISESDTACRLMVYKG